MNTVVVGGHTRNIGKTSVVSALIREFAPLGWTAVKITQYGHGVCSRDGRPCDCAPHDHPFALTEEARAHSRADTSRYLAAGARTSLWLRAREGRLGVAMPLLQRKLQGAQWVVIESNTILDFVEPFLYLVVLDSSRADFKPSALRNLDRADAFVTARVGGAQHQIESSWPAAADSSAFRSKPTFPVSKPDFWSPSLGDFLRRAFARANHGSSVPILSQQVPRREEIWPKN